ncbi:unnamed protein product [Schistosoma intercalatum]|nr:unnamed protein product [Schistosoma intercalatum]
MLTEHFTPQRERGTEANRRLFFKLKFAGPVQKGELVYKRSYESSCKFSACRACSSSSKAFILACPAIERKQNLLTTSYMMILIPLHRPLS